MLVRKIRQSILKKAEKFNNSHFVAFKANTIKGGGEEINYRTSLCNGFFPPYHAH